MTYEHKVINEKRSFTEYTVSSPTQSFAIGFELYEDEQNISVTLNSKPIEDLGYTFVVINSLTIEITPAIPSGVLRIQRETDIDDNKHKFSAGAIFNALSMDENFEQIRQSQQETRDGFVNLSNRVVPLVDGLEEALDQAATASQAAQDAADAAEEAAQTTRMASQVFDESGETQQALNNKFKTYSNFYVSPENFYNPIDGEDWYNAIQAAVDTRLPVQLAGKSYKVSKAISVYDNTILHGCGKDVTFIEKTTSETSSNGKDVIVYLNPLYSPWTLTVRKIDLNGLKLTRTNPNVGFGLYGDGLCLSTIKNFDVDGCRDGIHIKDSWMNTWNQCTSSYGKPWYIGKGTSNTFISCWATDVSSNTDYGDKCYAWDIGGEYNTMLSCGADRVGTNGDPAEAVWRFATGSNMTVTSLACEIIHAKKLAEISNTSVTIGNIFTWQFFNKYGDSSNFGYFEISDNATLDVQNGKIDAEYTSANIPVGSLKPIFATLRNNSSIQIGDLKLIDKITGIGDATPTMIDHDGTGAVLIAGQTSYTYSNANNQHTLNPSIASLFTNRQNFDRVHAIKGLSLGSLGTASDVAISFHSAGNKDFVNSRLLAYGGTSTEKGTIQVDADVFESLARTNYFTGAIELKSAKILSGAGAPNGVVPANIGSMYLRTDGGAGTTLYVKESGNGTNTGWVGK